MSVRPRPLGLLTPLIATVTALVLAGPAHAEGDRLFPRTGSTAYDALHYDLRLSYVPRTQRLRGRAIVTARAARPAAQRGARLPGLPRARVRLNGRAATFSRRATR